MKDFEDKVSVITEAASGIGFGLAGKCAREGIDINLLVEIMLPSTRKTTLLEKNRVVHCRILMSGFFRRRHFYQN